MFDFVREFWARIYRKYGAFIARGNGWIIAVPVVICGLLAIGIVYADQCDDLDIFAPLSSEPMDMIERFTNSFGSFVPSTLNMLFKYKNGSNVLTEDFLTTVNNGILSLMSEPLPGATNETFQTICHKLSGSCVFSGPLVAFSMNSSAISASPSIVAQLQAYWTAQDTPPISEIGAYDADAGTGDCLLMSLVLNGSRILNEEEHSDDYKLGAYRLVEQLELDGIIASSFVMEAVSAEINSIVDSVVTLGIVGALIMLLYLSSFLRSNTHQQVSFGAFCCVFSRFNMLLVFLAAVGLTFVGTLGFLGFLIEFTDFGIISSQLTYTTPFLLLGLISDGFLVISSALSHERNIAEAETGTKLTPEQLTKVFSNACSHALPSITMVTVVSFGAFASGITTEIQAIRSFAVLCSILSVILLLVSILFVPFFFYLDLKRVNDRRNALFPCMTTSIEQKYLEATPDEQQHVSKFWRHWSAIFMHKYFRFVVIIVLVGLGVYGFVNQHNLSRTLEVASLPPADSNVVKALNMLSELQRNETVGLVFENYNVKSKSFYALMTQALANATDWPYVSSVETNTLAATFGAAASVPALASMLDADFFPVNDVAFDTIVGALLSDNQFSLGYGDAYYFEDASNVSSLAGIFTTFRLITEIHEYRIEWLESIIELANELTETFEPFALDGKTSNVYFYSAEMMNGEQERALNSMIIPTLITAIVVLIIIVLFFIGDPIMAIVMGVSVAFIIGGILLSFSLFDQSLDAVGCVLMLVAVGVSVDALSHLVMNFGLSTESTTIMRMELAFTKVGSAALHALVTTFLGVAALLLSPGYILNSFAVIFAEIIICSILSAFCLLPSLLSFFPDPKPSEKTLNDTDDLTIPDVQLHTTTTVPKQTLHSPEPEPQRDPTMIPEPVQVVEADLVVENCDDLDLGSEAESEHSEAENEYSENIEEHTDLVGCDEGSDISAESENAESEMDADAVPADVEDLERDDNVE